MKRITSLFVALLMVISVFSGFAVIGNAATIIEISNTSPAITADVGEKINLSDYTVVFDGDTAATSGVTWKSDGKTVTSITPSQKGVVELTATKGSKSKTVYLVAKEKNETEYVLYEADFSDYSSLNELKNEGWNLMTSNVKLENDTLVLGSTSDSYARVILPAWLGDFGDYAISSDLKMLSTTDTGRWVGLVYRIQNANKQYYPYYHMCVRENTTASGIEFAERTTGNDWNVVLKSSGEIASLKNAYNNFTVKAFGKTISYQINNSEVMFVTEDYISKTVNGSSAASYSKGMLGLTMNYGTVAFKNIKVTVQESAPVKAPKKLDLINNSREDIPLINPIANVELINSLADLEKTSAGSVYVDPKLNANYNDIISACVKNQILPTIIVGSQSDVDNLAAALKANGCKDANVIAMDPKLLGSIRKSVPTVRTGLIVDPDDYDSYHDLRVAVRSAPATFCVIPEGVEITKETVMEIQEYAVAVWVAAIDDTDIITAVSAGVNGIITESAADTAALINKHFVDNAMTRTPIMIGHRGNPSQAPENSLSGFIAAYENGADVFEVDVEITKDGQIIIMHDNTLNRTTTYTGTKTVNQMTLAEVKAEFILGKDGKASTEKVPTLKEVLDEFKDKDCKIFVEFKGSNAANVPATMKLLDEYDMDYLVDVISFSGSFLTQTQQESPGMSTGYLVSGKDNGTNTEDALESLYAYLVTAQGANSTINPASGIVNSKGNYFTKAATDRGITVWPWTYIYTSNDIGFFSGCDGVTTDDVQWAHDMAKYLVADDIDLAEGQTYAGGKIYEITYGNAKNEIDISKTVYSVIEGEEFVTVTDGKLVGIKKGTAKVIFGYITKSATGREYVVYTQPVNVNVVDGNKEMLEEIVELAANVSINDYSSAVLADIRSCYDQAINMINAANAPQDEIESLIVDLSNLLGECVRETIISTDKKYETVGAMHSTAIYQDDGTKLTDGVKGGNDGGKYCGWTNPDGLDVIIDLGEAMKSDTYRIYAAGGTWGISQPNKVTVSVSDDGETFKSVIATNKVVVTADTSSWDTYLVTLKLDEAVEARYVKFHISPKGSFTWVDEVEVSYCGERAAADNSAYISGINETITAGASVIFTPDFGEITVGNANIRWTTNLIAKWDESLGAYVVKSITAGTGDTTPSIKLADDELLIAAHKWDVEDSSENPVIGSKKNVELIKNACVGDVITLNGITGDYVLSDVAPHAVIKHNHTVSGKASCTSDAVCSTCKDIAIPATGHDEGQWHDVDASKRELRCTVCNTLLETELLYKKGDVNMNGKIDTFDYAMIKRAYLGTTTLTDEQFVLADINDNGKLDVTEYGMVKRHYLGTFDLYK